jgi:glycosyltransferase involved in cell wall biosynthesis
MKKLKILVSAFACNPAGNWHPGEDIAGWNLTQQLSRFHDTWVISHSYNRSRVEKALTQNLMNSAEFHFITLPVWLRGLYRIEIGQRIYYYIWQIKAWRAARRLHRRVQFDVAHHITFNNDWMPSFIGAFLPVPFIWGPVGGGQRTPKSFFREYSLKGKINDRVREMAQWVGRNVLISRKRCLENAKAILVCNNETRDKIPKELLHKIHFFPVNGISPEDLSSSPDPQRSNNAFNVMTTGRLIHWKAYDIAIRSYAIFCEKYPQSKLTVIGTGPEEDRLKKLAKRSGCNSNIQFIPWLERHEWLSKLHSCDVFLFPSLREGGGAVVVEAMAHGKPVVCLDIAGPGFHIQDEWGIKVLPKNPDYAVSEMAKALEKLYLDENMRASMGESARRRAENYYLWDRLGERMQEIYQEALGI